MPATLRDVKKLAAKLGVKVEDDKCCCTHECRVEAPRRKVWKCGGIHELIDYTNQPWKPDYDDILNRMNYGLEDCTDPDCEWCNNA